MKKNYHKGPTPHYSTTNEEQFVSKKFDIYWVLYYCVPMIILTPKMIKIKPPIHSLRFPTNGPTFFPMTSPAHVNSMLKAAKLMTVTHVFKPIIPKLNPTEKLSILTLREKNRSPRPLGEKIIVDSFRKVVNTICEPRMTSPLPPMK